MGNATETGKSRKTQQLIFAGCITVAVLVSVGLMWLCIEDSETKIEKIADKSEFADVTRHAQTQPEVYEKFMHEIEQYRKDVDDLKSELKQKQQTGPEIQQMREQIAKMQQSIITHDAGVRESASQSTRESFQEMARQDNSLREDRVVLSPAKIAHNPAKNPDVYVPAGTFAKAVMLGGADASAAVNAQANPVPMLFRIIASGTLPNHRKSHLKDCVLTAAVVGDISSERGQIRTEHLSCVFQDGRVLDEPVEGTIFGPGGKNGVRGTPVWREGVLLQRAFAAGTLSGLSDGLSQTYTSNSISAEGNVQTVNPAHIFQYGAAKGAGKAMDRLADYNIQRAEQYHPVIQLSAGTVVDVVFLKGFYLDEKHDGKTEGAVDDGQDVFDVPDTARKTLPLSQNQLSKLEESGKALGFGISSSGESTHA